MPVKKFSIFLSHKKRDSDMASRLCEYLCEPCSGLLDVFLMEKIPDGDKWFDWITDSLSRSHMLLLLFTDPTEEWDWCLYETGYFSGLHSDDLSKVICIHDPPRKGGQEQSAPPQITRFQTVPLELEKVRNFLVNLYVNTKKCYNFPKPLAPNLVPGNAQLEDLAKRILSLLTRAPTRTEFYGKQIEITVSNPGNLKTPLGFQIPDSAAVSGSEGVKLFGLRGEATWDKVIDANLPEQRAWSEELAGAMHRAYSGGEPSPLAQSFRLPSPGGAESKRAYRPNLHRVDWLRDGQAKFSVLFSEEPSLERNESYTLPIMNFSQLIDKLVDLINSTTRGCTKMLALTPAIGYLAKSQEEWKKLEKAISDNLSTIEFICQTPAHLAAWHAAFEKRKTERKGEYLIESRVTGAANKISEKILSQVSRAYRLPWPNLPDYYLFTNFDRAILVNPFFLPNMDDVTPPEKRPGMPNVEMFGLVTNDKDVVDQFIDVQRHYETLAPAPRLSSNASGGV